MLCPFVALLSCEPREPSQIRDDDFPPETTIGGVPGWAMDVHTRQGRAAFARFLETDAPSARWVRTNIRPARRVPFFGHIVFRVESGLVVNRLRWPLADELRRQGDVECSYPDSTDDTEILGLTRTDVPILDEVRAAVAGGLAVPFDVLPDIEPTARPRAADAAALGHRPDAGWCRHLHRNIRPEVEAYVQAGIASATKRAYRADLDHFRAWGGSLPATDAQITNYLADHAAVLKVSTLTRRLAAISVAHEAKGFPNPTASPLVRATMRGIRRAHGAAQHQAKPLLREDLFVVLGAMGDRLKDLRDRALLLVGFAGGLRRSELAAINLIDFERVREGIILTIRRSKTDQDGVGRKIGIPFGRTIHCPVRALENWLSAARIEDGPVFRPVDRHGRVSASTLRGSRVLDPSRPDGRGRVRPYWVFRP